MKTERLLSQQTLPNGLTLEFWGRSRTLAGDRSQAVCELRVIIPITLTNLPHDLQARRTEVTAALGPELIFTKQEVRHFVATAEVDRILKEIQAQLVRSIQGYLGHPDFGAGFIRKKFAEYLEKKRWSQP